MYSYTVKMGILGPMLLLGLTRVLFDANEGHVPRPTKGNEDAVIMENAFSKGGFANCRIFVRIGK